MPFVEEPMISLQFKKFAILFLFLATAVSLIANVQAQDHEPPTPARLDPEQFEPIPYLETELADAFMPRPDVADVTTWGKVVFQSYRDGNWEIYTMDDGGNSQRRLTNHAKSDVHPRFNRGNTLIAFASNRDGDYEIYVMNADGTGLKQLTNNSTDDVNPVWSFDGTKLAFQAYRDTQAEIYTMNSNGSGQTRLTYNGAYEGTPTWSPDGQKIAFVSNRSGGYRIYVK
jgi:Tol biopolymer transport system component